MAEKEKLALNLTEAAEVLSISRSAMYDVANIPGFPVVRLGRRVLINRKKLSEWLDARTEDGSKICLK